MRYLFILFTCVLSSLVFADKTLIIADVHFTPFAQCGKLPLYCSKLNDLEHESVSQWSFSEDATPSTYKMETNNFFLTWSLKSLSAELLNETPQSIFIMGDLLTHEFSKKFKYYKLFASKKEVSDFEFKTLAYVLLQIQKNFSKSKIYYVLGNNDTDNGNYNFPTYEWLNDVAVEVSKYLPATYTNDIIWQFKRGGYYSLPLNDKLQIIGLNTNVFSSLSTDSKSDEVAQQELKWLNIELNKLVAQNKKVIILQHMPLGADPYKTSKSGTTVFLLKDKFLQGYLKLLKKYNKQIVSIYAGHLHSEYWQNIYGIPVIGTIALNKLFGNNAGVKLVDYNSVTGKINTFTTYTVSFVENKPHWNILYNFPKDYNNTHETIARFIESFPYDIKESSVKEYRRVYNGDATKYLQPLTNNKYWPIYFCFTKFIESESFNNCLHLK